jgi:hypothetical protein
MNENLMILYRPVGVKELELIAAADYRAFPPRLFWQPIFYPVLNFEYAEQIALRWNTCDAASGYAGFVTQFEVDRDYINQYPVKVVGSETVNLELWVPAERLEEFNQHLQGKIRVVASYYGVEFEGEVDPVSNLPRSVIDSELDSSA